MNKGQKKTYVSTPQGTVPLEEYGSFKPQFNVGKFPDIEYLDVKKIKGYGDRILSTDDLGGVAKSLTEACRTAMGVGALSQRPLPTLDKINAHVEQGWFTYINARNAQKKLLERHAIEIKKMSDHELNVYIHLARSRSNGVYGNSRTPSKHEVDKYLMALEERASRTGRRI